MSTYCEPSQEACQENLLNHIEGLAKSYRLPFVLILEFGHFSTQSAIDLVWAVKNILFAEHLCSLLVKRFRRDVRIVSCIIVNDLGSSHFENVSLPHEILSVLTANRFLTSKKVCLISERNLRNIATRRLKKIAKESSQRLLKDFDRLFLANFPNMIVDDAALDVCPAVGNVSLKDGHVIPRCGAIMASFVEKAIRLASSRLHWKREIDAILLSFAKNDHELRQTIFGLNVYLNGWPNCSLIGNLNGVIVLWGPESDCEISLIRQLETK